MPTPHISAARVFFSVALALTAGCSAPSGKPEFRLEPVAEYTLPSDSPEGLSGIAWLGGDRYALAEDSGGRIHFARIGIDLDSGTVTNCHFEKVLQVPCLVDAEGIAFDADSGILYIADECGPKVIGLSPGAEPKTIRIPPFYENARGNKSLESLALSSKYGRQVLWTANEDALRGDGDVSSATNGSTVRITAFPPQTNGKNFFSWWSYPLEKAQGSPVPGASRQTPFNGVADIAVLPDDSLLVLERSCGLIAAESEGDSTSMIECRIWLAAPPTSRLRQGETLKKRPLWRQRFPASNFEGMALGPVLADGSRAVVLVSDGDVTTATLFGKQIPFQWAKSLFTLRLCAIPPCRHGGK